jgi:hypothetical protein
MLSYDLLANHAGILLCGDYTSLRALHDIIHEVNEASTLIEDKESWFIALAYDVRKAYEKQRETLPAPKLIPERGTLYGVKLLWPVILLQCGTLRSSLQTFDSTKRQQAMTYALEHAVYSALSDDFGDDAPAIIETWQSIPFGHPLPGTKLDSRGAVFSEWSGDERSFGFAGLLLSLNPMYPDLYAIRTRNGQKGLLPPDYLDSYDGQGWVDPKW